MRFKGTFRRGDMAAPCQGDVNRDAAGVWRGNLRFTGNEVPDLAVGAAEVDTAHQGTWQINVTDTWRDVAGFIRECQFAVTGGLP